MGGEWKDIWCGKDPLCEVFPTLYNLAVSKGAMVADVWDINKGGGAWMPSFERPLNDWEILKHIIFLCMLNNRSIKQEGKDGLFWKGGQKGHVHCQG